jgi:tyrosine phenol-lyase
VFIDLLTDSGTSAMSDVQWAGMMRGDEAYAGSRNFYHLCDAIQDVMGYEYVVPTHQGRGAEHLFFKNFLNDGDIVPMNMYFTTTRQHAELAGGIFKDIIVDAAHDPASKFEWKGNVDLRKLEALVKEYGTGRVRMVSMAPDVNMAGGQPYSIANARAVFEYCQHGTAVSDSTRIAENAFFIEREPIRDWSIKET